MVLYGIQIKDKMLINKKDNGKLSFHGTHSKSQSLIYKKNDTPLAADVLHHLAINASTRQVGKLQCALIFAFDLTHQY